MMEKLHQPMRFKVWNKIDYKFIFVKKINAPLSR